MYATTKKRRRERIKRKRTQRRKGKRTTRHGKRKIGP